MLGIGWNLIEMLYGMYINGFDAWKFQKACRCHGNRIQILKRLLFTFVLN
jgi:hypothetical protein